MIHQDFVEPETPEWAQWKHDAMKATERLLAKMNSGHACVINEKLYKRMRHVFYDAFHGKCAYCEAKFVLDQSGAIDHFRPKGEVRDLDCQRVLLDGEAKTHPGYYWLVYDWHNLLPVCNKCNTMMKNRDGKWAGKGARFPVKRNWWASHPGEEIHEEPLLIHPAFEQPEEYLDLDEKTGWIYAKDNNEKGRACIELFDLNREGLPETRRRIYTSIRMHIRLGFDAAVESQWSVYREHIEVITDYEIGAEVYAMAGRKALNERPELLSALRGIGPRT